MMTLAIEQWRQTRGAGEARLKPPKIWDLFSKTRVKVRYAAQKIFISKFSDKRTFSDKGTFSDKQEDIFGQEDIFQTSLQ